jgi:hypothetical protein
MPLVFRNFTCRECGIMFRAYTRENPVHNWFDYIADRIACPEIPDDNAGSLEKFTRKPLPSGFVPTDDEVMGEAARVEEIEQMKAGENRVVLPEDV